MLFHILFLLIVIIGSYTIEAACESGWFGAKCQFQCHCYDSPCDDTGQCANNKCAYGWFGFKCQYQDIVNSIQVVNVTNQIDTSQWQDGNDYTCLINQVIKSVAITLRIRALFLWLRVTVSDKAFLDQFKLHFEDVNVVNKRYECHRMKVTLFDERTADIRCELKELVGKVVLEGDGISSVCSLYISGGRNLALKQTAEQSSTEGSYVATNAVDGNTNARFNEGTCTKTSNITEPLQNWTLTFDESVVINSFDFYDIYDQVSSQYNASIITVNEENTVVFSSFYPYSYISSWYNIIVHPSTTPVKRLTIYASLNYYPTSIISFCEIKVLGECRPGKWGLDCKQTCDSKCPDLCREFDGSCPTHCLGFSDPPNCTKECPPDKWGLNCKQDCSERCQYKYCDSVDGLCTAGCDGYSNPPYCTQACSSGFYGVNCKQEISGVCVLRNKACTSDQSGSSSFHGHSFGIGVGTTLAIVAVLAVAAVFLLRYFGKRFWPKDSENKLHMTNAIGQAGCHRCYDTPHEDNSYGYENPSVVN